MLPAANTYNIKGLGLQYDVIQPVQVIPGDGAITLLTGLVILTKGSAAAITIGAPLQDGQVLVIYSETAFAHVVTCASVGFKRKAASGTCTFTAAADNFATIVSRNGQWDALAQVNATFA